MEPRKTALPRYTVSQERANSISHFIGYILVILGAPFLIQKAAGSGSIVSLLSAVAFLICAGVLYLGSAIYHILPPSDEKRVWRVLDHNNVFLLIMGTYTPYCLVGLHSFPAWGYAIFGIVMFLGVAGIVLNSIDLTKFKVFCYIDYLLMGWTIIISFYPLTEAIGFWNGTFLLLLGGLAYSFGAILYGLGAKKSQWLHFVFHLFCLLGTALMYFSLLLYVF